MSISATSTHVLYRELYCKDQPQQQFSPQLKNLCFGIDRASKHCGYSVSRRRDREVRVDSFWRDLTRSRPTSVDMEPINDLDQFDQILAGAQELSQPIIVDWMASWCRKCIYLKPKLEYLAAEFDTKVKFYYVDVNKVSQDLVKKGNISKMPTIQLWKDGEMKAEVIGGHEAWLVINEVREMIQKFT